VTSIDSGVYERPPPRRRHPEAAGGRERGDPEDRRPEAEHVGDDSAYGGAGAWWTPSKAQLVAYRDDRILRIRAPDRRSAVRVARLAFRRLSEPDR